MSLTAVFVSYDGALDPLGGSQVVPYLAVLSQQGADMTLISFEKAERWADGASRTAMRARLAESRIEWAPLPYHKRPRLPATLWDLASGAFAVTSVARRRRADIVHCRGDLAMAMARAAVLPRGTRLVYEARGLFSEERVEIGSWRRGGLVDRAVRRLEARNLERADGLLAVMSPAGLEHLSRQRPRLPPYRSLPNSVDLRAFTPRLAGEQASFGLVYCGSLGGWYMTEEMVAFAKEAAGLISGRVLFLTHQLEDAGRAGIDSTWAELHGVAPSEVPAWLRRARASFFLIRPTPAKRASSPTKVAESLASGLPIVANTGVGDLDDILEREGVGVLVRGFERESYVRAARQLSELLSDPGTPLRCRRLAELRYGLDAAVAAYLDLYREVLSANPGAS